MVGFTQPDNFVYDYQLDAEKANFDRFFVERKIPDKQPDQLDLASWNIANLGQQKRRSHDLALIAHILGKFDIIAVQEINENLEHFREIMAILKDEGFAMMMTDTTGNTERLAVIYRTDRVRPAELFGELDYNPTGKVIDGKYVILPKVQKFKSQGKEYITQFYNFNRNPFLSTWEVIGSPFRFLLANAHLYYGADGDDNPMFRNRIAEAYFLAKWASGQRKKDDAKIYERNIILIGDMNVPKMSSDDPVYRALKRQGMIPTKYSTEAGSTIQDFNTYDQIVFSKNDKIIIEIHNNAATVVDFDNFLFPDLWQQVKDDIRTLKDFKAWTRFAISDHRPLFVRLKV